jgi:hypothetical protein
MHICATCRWILHYYEVRNVIQSTLMIILELWKKVLWINKQEHLNDKQCSTIISIISIILHPCLFSSLFFYLDPLGTPVDITQFWWNYLSLTCAINDSGSSEGYIFANVMTKEFNNQHHQHWGT